MEAIQNVYSEDGVLVLMDLGSAVLSAGMALELLPPEMRENIRFLRRAAGRGRHRCCRPDWAG